MIKRDPKICFGRYHIRGIPVTEIKSRWRAGESVASIAKDWKLSDEELEAALTFRDPRVKVYAETLKRLMQ